MENGSPQAVERPLMVKISSLSLYVYLNYINESVFGAMVHGQFLK